MIIDQPNKPTKKFGAKWTPGSEFLPPNTIEQSIGNLLLGDKTFGDGKMTHAEAKKLVIQFREKYGEPQCQR